MNRQQFLISLWSKFFKPLLILTGLVYGLLFFINALDANSNERQLIELLVFGLVVAGIFVFATVLIGYILRLLTLSMPHAWVPYVKKAFRVMTIALLIIMVTWVAYQTYVYAMAGDYLKLWIMVGLAIILAFKYF